MANEPEEDEQDYPLIVVAVVSFIVSLFLGLVVGGLMK